MAASDGRSQSRVEKVPRGSHPKLNPATEDSAGMFTLMHLSGAGRSLHPPALV